MSAEKLTGAIPKEIFKPLIIQHLDGREPDLSTANLISANAFHKHEDRSGASYIIHLQQVFLSGTHSAKKLIVGVLHDLLEDSDWTVADLRDVGFAPDIVEAVDDLTHRPGEMYFDSIERIGLSLLRGDGNNLLSIDVKIADLNHNLSGSRYTELMTDGQHTKQQAYIVAYNYLVAIKRHEIKPGTSFAAFMELRPKLKDLELLQKYSSNRDVKGRSVDRTTGLAAN